MSSKGDRQVAPLNRGKDDITRTLTAAERRVADLAAEGLTNREIAQALFVSRKTVEMHLGHAYRKLDIHTRAELPAALGEYRT
jgi:DNA-binding CsgD family transcriptional regulator